MVSDIRMRQILDERRDIRVDWAIFAELLGAVMIQL